LEASVKFIFNNIFWKNKGFLFNKYKIMKKIIIILLLLVAAAAGAFWLSQKMSPKETEKTTVKNAPVIIGLSQGSTLEERWETDSALFTERAEQLGAVVNRVISSNNVDTQIEQIKNLIGQGVKVIVVIAADSEKLAPVVAEANAAGVKIIAYDRMIKNSNLDYYISFDNVKVGKLEAESVLAKVGKGDFAYIGGSPSDNNAFLVKEGSMGVLTPKINSGDIKLVVEGFMNNWDPTEAYKTIKEYLATGKNLDAVVAANDGTAFGVIKALQERGLAGRVPVSGQDADLAACQRIIAGTQTATVYKPIKSLASKAAEMAAALARGAEPETNNAVNNGKVDVPSFLLEPVIVNKDNMMDTVVKDGFHTYNEVYKEMAK
jgi:D-xylose transport system substrate-binding protein